MVAEPLSRPLEDRTGHGADPEPSASAPPRRYARLTAAGPAPSSSVAVLSRAERSRVLDAFRSLLPLPQSLEPSLRQVLLDLVEHPGSLARAQLAYGVLLDCRRARVADSLPSLESALGLAVAVEFFHTASLVFDDMPAMDDATERRGRPCPHVTHGEAAATLGALALITRGYGLLWETLGSLPAPRRTAAGELVSTCLGAEGILDGQARDLRFGLELGLEPGLDPARADAASEDPGAEVLRVAAGKTVPLVRLAVVLPALVGGADDDAVDHLERLSEAWGLAYQILDDFKDRLMSREETGKSTARDGALGRPNLPEAIGPRAAMRRLEGLLAAGRDALEGLRACGFPAGRLSGLQRVLEKERRTVASRLTGREPSRS